MGSDKDKLARYRHKRRAGATFEPFAPASPSAAGRPQRFMVHEHAARRLHYDLRLELDGVLVSFAIPKGPSPDPAEKRLAVHVEDHPLPYGDYEGVIPEGNYGAGPTLVWDRGRVVFHDEPRQGLKSGKLLFSLEGYKLRGMFTLVRTKGSSKDWLLIKKPDGHAKDRGSYPERSVLSGLGIDELGRVAERREHLRERLRQRCKSSAVRAAAVELMLAERAERPFSKKGWLFEVKYDGFRLLAGKEAGKVVLRYRRGGDATAVFPEIALALAALPADDLVLDGEVVVPDAHGRPRFQLLQQRFQLQEPRAVEAAVLEHPAVYYAFDVLGLEGFDTRPLPLAERKALLAGVVPALGPLRYAEHFEERGEELFHAAERLGLEGVVGKAADAPYRGGRQRTWLKVRAQKTAALVVVGYTRPGGSCSGFGALHLAGYRDGALLYAGRVGSGFSEAQLGTLAAKLGASACAAPACAGAPAGREHCWVTPELVCEVRYTEWTEEGLLRQPVFLRLRDDKPVAECEHPAHAELSPSLPTAAPPPRREVELTNTDKVFFPREGYTKGDLLAYYRDAAPLILPYLRDRPVVLTRYPDGIAGKSFFQKDAPGFVPAWLRTERMWSEQAERDVDAFVCDDVESLLYVVNLGTIPLHVWASRTRSLQQPDWCILDFDPKGAPFQDVVTLAKAARALCDELGLPSYAKTSGQAGLHVLVPTGGALTFDQTKVLAELLATLLATEHHDIATIVRNPRRREGKVYVDFLQNGHGKLLVAPYSVRAVDGAPVSTPLHWREVTARLDPKAFTIATVLKRRDPWQDLLTVKPDLHVALGRLLERVERPR